MAQISFSFSGGFWPISFPLFHGTTRPSALGVVLVAACMNGSFVGGKEPHVDPGPRALVDAMATFGISASGLSPRLFEDFGCLYQYRLRNLDTERFRGLGVDEQLELRRLLNRQITGLRAFQYLVDICRCAPKQIWNVHAIGHECTILYVFPSVEHRWKP